MKEKLKEMNEKSFPNVQRLTLEELKYLTGGASLQEGTFPTTTASTTTKPTVAML